MAIAVRLDRASSFDELGGYIALHAALLVVIGFLGLPRKFNGNFRCSSSLYLNELDKREAAVTAYIGSSDSPYSTGVGNPKNGRVNSVMARSKELEDAGIFAATATLYGGKIKEKERVYWTRTESERITADLDP